MNVKNLESIYSYLKQSGISATAVGGSDFMNTIWSSIQDIQTIKNGDSNQKTQGIQNLIQKALVLIEKFIGMNNEKTKASKETSENKDDAIEVNEEIDNISKEIKAQISEIIWELDSHIDLINTAIENLQAEASDLESLKAELEAIKAEIEEQQEALKVAKTADEQKTILTNIRTLAESIPAIAETLKAIQDSMATESNNIANAYSAVETLKGNAVEVTTVGEEKISIASKTIAEETQDNAESITTATAENIPTATTATTAATAAAATPVTAAQAPKLYATAADQTAAATTRITGSGSNLGQLLQAIGGINSASSVLGEAGKNIEETLAKFDTSIGKWNETISPIIQCLGSIKAEDITSASEDLVTTVETDLESLEKNDVASEILTVDNNTEIDNSEKFQTIKFEMNRFGFGI